MRLRFVSTILVSLVATGCSEPEEQQLGDLRACDLEPVCGSVASECVDADVCDYDEDDICTLEGLRDHTRGLYQQINCEGVCSGEFVYVSGPESPVRRQSYYVEQDGNSQIEMLGDIETCELRADASAFFQACLDTPDTNACLSASQWVMNCAPDEHPNCG
jgi:hypothetical protein